MGSGSVFAIRSSGPIATNRGIRPEVDLTTLVGKGSGREMERVKQT